MSFTRKTRATSRDISLWVVFVKVDDERNVHSDPPYCGYQTGTCTTCGSGNLPRAAYTCHDLFAECPTIRARHERRSLDRPHSASMILSLRERTAPVREYETKGNHAVRTGARYLFTLRACERTQLYRLK